jgi:hypothetical protein
MKIAAPLVAGLVAAVCLPLILVVVLLGDAQASFETGCFVSPGGASASGDPMAGLDAEAAGNARIIVATVQARHLPVQAAVITLVAARQESGVHALGYGDAVGPDSRGVLQQRSDWGPLAVRMDPAGATGLFLDRLVNVAGYLTMSPDHAAHVVQGNERESDYTKWVAWGRSVAPVLLGQHGVTVACGGASGPAGPSGPVPVSLPATPAAAVAYQGPADGGPCDVANGGGCIREVTAHGLAQTMKALGPQIRSAGCYSHRDGDHGKGLACDFMITMGKAAAGKDLIRGWQVAAWLRANASNLHVAYLIWDLRLWDSRHTAPDDSGGWGQSYAGCSYCGALGDPSADHTNHVHVSFISPETE